MNKRLRKKKRVGEFTEWGRQLVVRRNRKDGFDEFLDAFIQEAIEANGFYCGGGGTEDQLDVVVELGRSGQDLEGRSRRVTAWLDARSDVEGYGLSDLFDLWHGPFQPTPAPIRTKRLHATAGGSGRDNGKDLFPRRS